MNFSLAASVPKVLISYNFFSVQRAFGNIKSAKHKRTQPVFRKCLKQQTLEPEFFLRKRSEEKLGALDSVWILTDILCDNNKMDVNVIVRAVGRPCPLCVPKASLFLVVKTKDKAASWRERWWLNDFKQFTLRARPDTFHKIDVHKRFAKVHWKYPCRRDTEVVHLYYR